MWATTRGTRWRHPEALPSRSGGGGDGGGGGGGGEHSVVQVDVMAPLNLKDSPFDV